MARGFGFAGTTSTSWTKSSRLSAGLVYYTAVDDGIDSSQVVDSVIIWGGSFQATNIGVSWCAGDLEGE